MSNEAFDHGHTAGQHHAAFVAAYGPRTDTKPPLWYSREPNLSQWLSGYEQGVNDYRKDEA